MSGSDASPSRPRSPLASLALALGALALLLLLVAGPGSRFGLWHFRTGFTLLRWAVYGGLAAGGVGLLAALHARPGAGRRGLGMAVVAMALGLGAAYVPWSQLRLAGEVPRIHDVTTDTEDPPFFVAVVPLRVDASNPVEYQGEEVARLQREGYPDLETVELEMAPEAAFDAALEAARSMGWEIVAAEPDVGRIEATATTFWFGFKDDVVIRIRPASPVEDGQDRVELDVRSLSRVGGSDLGANAARVRAYLEALDGALGEAG